MMSLNDVPINGPWTVAHVATLQKALEAEVDPKRRRLLSSVISCATQRHEELDPRCRCQANFAAGSAAGNPDAWARSREDQMPVLALSHPVAIRPPIVRTVTKIGRDRRISLALAQHPQFLQQ